MSWAARMMSEVSERIGSSIKVVRENRVSPRMLAWGAVIAVLLLAIALRVAVWALRRDLWLDEAMLYAALAQESALRPWGALGLFEQSCPYFLALLWRTLITLAGPNELILRLPSLLASIGGLVALGLLARRRGFGVLGTGAVLAIAGLSEVAIFQSAQLKQYSFELLATSSILLTAERALRQIRAGHLPVSFLLVSMLMLPVSYAAPVVTAACAAAVLVATKLPHVPLEHHRRTTEIWRLALLAAPWAVSVLVWHRYAVTPSTYFQFTAYPYAQYYLALADVHTWRFLDVVAGPLKPQLGSSELSNLAAGVIAVAWVCGLAIGWRRDVFAHAAAVTLFSLFIALSLLHLLPLAASRHFLFALPVFALSFGAAMQALTAWWLQRNHLTARGVVVAAGVLLLTFSSGFLRTDETRSEEVRKALVSSQGQRCRTIWAYYAAWPAVLVYRQSSIANFIGEIATQSVTSGWTAPIRQDFSEYVRETRDLLAERPEVCLLFSHVREGEQAQLLAAASTAHHCNAVHEGGGASLYKCRRRPAPGVDP